MSSEPRSLSEFYATLPQGVVTMPDGIAAGDIPATPPSGGFSGTNVQAVLDEVAAAASAGVSDGDKGDITVSGGGTAWAIDAGAVSNSKLASVATATLKGRVTGGAGDPEDLTGTQATTLLDVFTSGLKGLAPASGGGTTNFLRADGTWAAPPTGGISDGDKGDITVSGGGATWTIDNGAVTDVKLGTGIDAAKIANGTVSNTEFQYINSLTSDAQTQITARALDSAVVHNTGNESVGGIKTFTSDPIIPDEIYGVGWNGVLEPPTKNAVYDKVELVVADVALRALDTAVVHNTGNESVGGVKTFTDAPIVPTEVYGPSWNTKNQPPTKDAVYDKIEAMVTDISGKQTALDIQDEGTPLLTNPDSINFTGAGVTATNLLGTITVDIPGGSVADGDKGDVTVSGSGSTWTIDNDAVSNAKLANVGTATIKGRVTAGTGDPEDLTGTQATTLLDVFTSALKGLAPASGGGTANFLRADGTWAAPPTGGISDGDKGDISVTASGATWTIDNNVVSFAKMADMNASRLIGRVTAGAGDPEEVRVSGGIEFDGVSQIQTSAFTGDVTKAAGDTVQTIANDAVTNAKLANVATATIKGRVTAATGDPEDLTGTQATTLLDVFTSALKGLAPASGGGTANFLRADGTWAAPTAADPGGWTTIVKSANQDVTNLGLTNDTEFSFATVANGHYAIEMDLIISGNNTTGDYTMDFQVAAGTQTGKGTCQNITAAAAVQNIIVTAAGVAATTAIVTGAPTASLDDLVAVRVFYACTVTNATTFRFRFGNSAAAAGRTSRTWKGSIFRWKRLD